METIAWIARRGRQGVPGAWLWAALATGLGAAGPYDALPIRGPLAAQACYRTELGRERKRGADQPVNAYRLYDFYRRQADLVMADPAGQGDFLPPFPGLDGGRRGHWGGTNEKTSVAFPRDREPEPGGVASGGGTGEWFIRSGGGVIGVDTLRGGLTRVLVEGRLARPEHALGAKVDRFGLELAVHGALSLKSDGVDWTRGGKPVGCFAGYRVLGERVAVDWTDGRSRWLDEPRILRGPESSWALQRCLRFPDGTDAGLAMALPLPPGDGPVDWSTRRAEGGRMLEIAAVSASGKWLHRVWLPEGGTALLVKDPARIEFGAMPAAAVVVVSSGPGKSELPAVSSAPGDPGWLAGGTAASAPEILVRGRLNADPEAAGSAYEVDDIPVPVDHPGLTPMTLSGLAFDPAGTAYVCTLVGDVWRVRGLTGDLSGVRWMRIASGLDQPMGLQVHEGAPHVLTRRNLFRLEDLNGDGVIDFFQRVNRMPLPDAACGRDLKVDASGGFFFNTPSGIHRLTAEGNRLERVGGAARNPLGLALLADGTAISDSSEGNAGNGTCTLYESNHPGNAGTAAKRKRILYLPRGVDNSPGTRMIPGDPRFGPLGNSLIGVSYGTGTWYSLLRDRVEGTSQMALVPQRGLFTSGACRMAVQPADGQVFVAGLDGWGDYAIEEGSLHRLRHTGVQETRPVGWKAYQNGILVEFDHPLAGDPVHQVLVRQWNYRDVERSYGSPEFSVREPDRIGHDVLKVSRTLLLGDGRSLFIGLPDLRPSMCCQVRARVRDAKGREVELDLYVTLQKLRPDAPWTVASGSGHPDVLIVPEEEQGVDSYQALVEHFDRLAGRDPATRALLPDAAPGPGESTYEWFRVHLVDRACMPCHGAGTQHDLTTYEGLRAKLRPGFPGHSVLAGMVRTRSMPPYPLPAVPPRMLDALEEWIRQGAPR